MSLPDNIVRVGDYECQEDRVTPVMTENFVPGGSISHALRHADEDLRVGKLVSDSFGSTEWSRLPANSRGGSLELETWKLLKDSHTHNMCYPNNQLNSCSCSFCLKCSPILAAVELSQFNL